MSAKDFVDSLNKPGVQQGLDYFSNKIEVTG